jgi:hypothetical protein
MHVILLLQASPKPSRYFQSKCPTDRGYIRGSRHSPPVVAELTVLSGISPTRPPRSPPFSRPQATPHNLWHIGVMSYAACESRFTQSGEQPGRGEISQKWASEVATLTHLPWGRHRAADRHGGDGPLAFWRSAALTARPDQASCASRRAVPLEPCHCLSGLPAQDTCLRQWLFCFLLFCYCICDGDLWISDCTYVLPAIHCRCAYVFIYLLFRMAGWTANFNHICWTQTGQFFPLWNQL